MDDATLRELMEKVLANREQRETQLQQLDTVDEVIRLGMSQSKGIDPVIMKIVQTLSVLRAADRLSAEAVDELAKFVDDRRGRMPS